jgi:hypothetical protein
MREVRREQIEAVNTDPTVEDVVTTTDPVTGQVVHVNRTTGQVVTHPGVTHAIYRRTIDPDAPAAGTLRQHQISEDYAGARRMRIYKAEQIIYLLFGIAEALIGIRFMLRLLAANPAAGFASFIYSITDPLVAPFVSLFSTPAYDRNVVELGSIVAIIIYALVAWLLVRVLWLIAGEDRGAIP